MDPIVRDRLFSENGYIRYIELGVLFESSPILFKSYAHGTA